MLKVVSLLTFLVMLRLSESAAINDTNKSPPNVYQSQKKYIRACYYTNWAQWRPGRGKYVAEDYIPGLCTHILYAFGKMKDDSTAINFEDNDVGVNSMYKRLNAHKEKDPGLKTLLSFGGWTMGSAPFEKITGNAANKKRFIDSTISFVRQWGFNGIDIDWEYPSAQQKAGYVDFISALRTAINAESSSPENRLLLTAAVPAGQSNIDPGYDIEKLAPLFDFILVMTYDFHGSWEAKTGFNSPLFSAENESPKTLNTEFAVNYWNKKGMPKEKIVVGIATYGRGWTLQNPSNSNVGAPGSVATATTYVREGGTASYYEICEMEASGGKVVWDDVQKVPYIVSGNQWFGYDNVQSVSLKADWIKENGFAGAFVWTLDFDDFNGQCTSKDGKSSPKYPLISAIAEKLGGEIGPSPSPVEGSTTPSSETSSPSIVEGFTTPSSETSSPSPIEGSTEGFTTPSSETSSPSIAEGSSTPLISGSSSIPISTVSSSMTTNGIFTTIQPGEFKCKEDGYFPDKDNCLQFFRCVGDRKFTFTCANGTSFHSDTNLCDFTDCSKCAGKKMESCGSQLE